MRLLVEIEHPGLQQIEQGLGFQPAGCERGQQRARHRIVARLRRRLAVERIGPEPQPHLPQQRLRHLRGHAGHLEVEGVERV